MPDREKDERIMFLLRLWFRLDSGGYHWPAVKLWVEQQLNAELPGSSGYPGDDDI